MNNTVTIKSTSNTSAIASDIVLRENNSFKLIFRPVVVDNQKNSDASVKGWFIYQRKDSDGQWSDFVDENLYGSKLKSGEGLKLEIKAEEILSLINHLDTLKQIYSKYGIQYGKQEFVLTDRNLKSVLDQIANFNNASRLIALSQLSNEKLLDLAQNLNQTRLSKLLELWNESIDTESENEGFWQRLFEDNAWVLSQIFACPYTQIGSECYYGGKKINNTGGVNGDFLFKNNLTDNVGFIEIKTPSTKLVGKKYRGIDEQDSNTVFSITEDLSGAINQLQNQRNLYIQKKDSLESPFFAHNPKAILIAGSISSLNSSEIKSFELYRNSLSNIEVLTYDELQMRINNLIELYKANE